MARWRIVVPRIARGPVTRSRRTDVADVLGVPALPSGVATVAVNRLRAGLGRLHGSMAPPPVRILEAAMSLLDHRALVALCDAGVPDLLTGPTEIRDLAERSSTDPELLERVLRFGATRGWVRIDRTGRVRPTRVTKFLRTDHPGGWRSWIDFAGGAEVTAAVAALTASASTDPFEMANGSSFFEWMAAHPDRWATFDDAMAAGARLHGLGLAAALDWSTDSTVCDVGGGTGALLATLLDLHPHLSGATFDLPAVVARSVDHPRSSVVGGDMFDEVPAGFDTYLLVAVVHDWGDRDAHDILRHVRRACRSGSRVVMVEQSKTRVPQPDLATSTDLLMAALTGGGKERSLDELVELGRTADLHHEHTRRLPSADLAVVFRT
jgi:hypothetical protein